MTFQSRAEETFSHTRSMIGFTIVFLMTTGVVFHARAQALSEEARDILRLKDQREIADGSLESYLERGKWRVRRDAAMALANIADTSSIPALVARLYDSSPSVRSAAAFALGQIKTPATEDTLASVLKTENNARVISQVLEALGKSGTAKSLRVVVRYRPPGRDKAVEEALAMGIARYALRGIKSERAVLRCFELLESRDSDTQWKAIYALWRMAPDSLIDEQVEARAQFLTRLAKTKISEVRKQLATLLGRSRSREAFKLLDFMKKNEPRVGSWRVRVQLVRAYARHAAARPAAVTSLEELLANPFENVRVAAMQSLAGLDTAILQKHENRNRILRSVRRIVRSNRSPDMLRGEGIVLIGKHSPDSFAYAPWLQRTDISDVVKTKIIEALGLIYSEGSSSTILKFLDDQKVRLASAAWAALPGLATSDGIALLQQHGVDISDFAPSIARKAKRALLRDDMALTTLVAQALSDSAVALFLNAEGFLDPIVEDLMLAYTRLSSPNDVEAMQAVVTALGRVGDNRAIPVLERALEDPDRTVALASAVALNQLTGKDYTEKVPKFSSPQYTDYSWKTLASIPSDLWMVIKTNRGSITIRLRKDDAPFTVLSFYKLVKKKFYNGLTFHRVVPDFVIQGGDPRGDGWGGPGYSIRTEVSLAGYERGSIGIASAGKDTEGCQFFITHSPQPHLDGRYTLFGQVWRGMGVVDKIQVGDRIEEIQILTSK